MGLKGSNVVLLENNMEGKEHKEILVEFSSSLEQQSCKAKSSM